MIVELVLTPFFGLISFIIGLVPDFSGVSADVIAMLSVPSILTNILGTGLFFLGSNIFLIVVTVYLTSWGLILGWSLVEWVYKKVPGVD